MLPFVLGGGFIILWERGQVVLFACGARPMTFDNLTSGKPRLDGLITDFMLDQTAQTWSHTSLTQ